MDLPLLQVLLDDHIVKTTTMKNSPFIGPFETEINAWDQTLVNKHLPAFLNLRFVQDFCIVLRPSQPGFLNRSAQTQTQRPLRLRPLTRT